MTKFNDICLAIFYYAASKPTPQDANYVEKWYDSDHMTTQATAPKEVLPFFWALPLKASNGGLFVSRGEGKHPDRIISSFELIFVNNGILELQEASRRFKVHAGETLLLWPGRPHGGFAAYPANLSFYWVHFYLNPQRGPRVTDALQEVQIPQHIRVSRPDHLTNLFRRFLDDQETATARSPAADLLLLLMLCEVMGPDTPQVASESASAALANRADTLIRTQFHKPLSTSRLARQLHCNPDYLGRVFRQFYGCTFTEAVHQRRLKHARKLLLEDALTTDAVASACGFSDAGYFRRVFRRAEGMTPYAFRKLYSKVHVNTG